MAFSPFAFVFCVTGFELQYEKPMNLENSKLESSPEEEVADSSEAGYVVLPISKTPSYGRMGLENPNNMCYMNSAIQV